MYGFVHHSSVLVLVCLIDEYWTFLWNTMNAFDYHTDWIESHVRETVLMLETLKHGCEGLKTRRDQVRM